MTHPDRAPLRCSPCLHPPPGPQQRGLVARDMGIDQAPQRASNRAGHRFPYGLFELWAAWFDPLFGPWSMPQPSATWQFQEWSHRSLSISGYPHLGGSQLITYNHAGIKTLRSNMRQLNLYTNIPRFGPHGTTQFGTSRAIPSAWCCRVGFDKLTLVDHVNFDLPKRCFTTWKQCTYIVSW